MIYFVTARDLNRVKIGYTDSLHSRIAKMRTDSPTPLVVERVCRGDITMERSLHDQFKAHRLAGEWFTIAPEIEAHMKTLERVIAPTLPMSLTKMITAATGVTSSYASMIVSPKYPHALTIPIAISVYRMFGERVGPLVEAEPHEIDILEKFCGTGASTKTKAA